jgi:hypothetical protein
MFVRLLRHRALVPFLFSLCANCPALTAKKLALEQEHVKAKVLKNQHRPGSVPLAAGVIPSGEKPITYKLPFHFVTPLFCGSKCFNPLTIGGKLANIVQFNLKINRLRYNQEVIRCGSVP